MMHENVYQKHLILNSTALSDFKHQDINKKLKKLKLKLKVKIFMHTKEYFM